MAGITEGLGAALPHWGGEARPRAETPGAAELSAAAALFAALLVPPPPVAAPAPPAPAPAFTPASTPAAPALALKSPEANVEKGLERIDAEGSAVSGLFAAPAETFAREAAPQARLSDAPVAPPEPPRIERIESSRLPGRESVRIEIAPDGPLGPVTLRLAVRDGAVTATVLAASEVAAARLRVDVEAARSALAARGVEVGSFVVAAPLHAGDGSGMGREGDETDGDPLSRRVAPIGGERPSRRRRARFDFTV